METAIRLEEGAYVSARAQSTTTTGTRPTEESFKFYIRQLAELVVDFVKEGVAVQSAKSIGVADQKGVLDLSGGGTRDFLSKEKAEMLFASILKDESDIHTVVLSSKSFGVEAAMVAAEALRKVKDTLKTADLSDIIGGRPVELSIPDCLLNAGFVQEHEALQVLGILSEALSGALLRKLDLSSNALGEKGLRACTKLFQSQVPTSPDTLMMDALCQRNLEELVLHNIGCSPDACAALKELTSGMQLHGLFLCNNMSGNEGGMAIGAVLSKMSSMKHFQMTSSRVGSVGIHDLSNGLMTTTTLLSLDLNDNPATADSLPGIVKVLNQQAHLQRLNLSDCSLGDDGIQQLSLALVKNVPNLEVLELALNEMTFEGIRHLAVALVSKNKLRVLDLHENELEDIGALIVAKVIINNIALEKLNLSGNAMHRTSAMAIVQALQGKQKFTSLCIDDNRISAEGIEEIKELLMALFKSSNILESLEENEEEEDNETFMDIDIEKTDLDQLVEKLQTLSVDD